MSQGGFIGFSAFAGMPSYNEPTEEKQSTGQTLVLPPLYDGNDPDINVICKKMLKKDVTTKIKALKELQDLCEDEARKPALTHLAPHFAFLFGRLALDDDRRVRAEACRALAALLRGGRRRAFAPLMGALVGRWWCLGGDPAAEVARAARAALAAAFPDPAKRAGVLGGRLWPALAAALAADLRATPQWVAEAAGGPPCASAEQAEDRFERVVASALRALARLLGELGGRPPPPAADGAAAGAAAEKEEEEEGPGRLAALVEEGAFADLVGPKLWKRLDAKRPALRLATWEVLGAVARWAPGLLLGGEGGAGRGEGGNQLGVVAALVARTAFRKPKAEEATPAAVRGLWEAVLSFYRAFPAAWAHAAAGGKIENEMIQPLCKLVRSNFYGAGSQGFPPLLPFVALMPPEILEACHGGRPAVLGSLLGALGGVADGRTSGTAGGGTIAPAAVGAADAAAAAAAACELATYALAAPRPPGEDEQSSLQVLELCTDCLSAMFRKATSWPPQHQLFQPLQKAIIPLHRATSKATTSCLISMNPSSFWTRLEDIGDNGLTSGDSQSEIRFASDLAQFISKICDSPDVQVDDVGFSRVIIKWVSTISRPDHGCHYEVLPIFTTVAERWGLANILSALPCLSVASPAAFYKEQYLPWYAARLAAAPAGGGDAGAALAPLLGVLLAGEGPGPAAAAEAGAAAVGAEEGEGAAAVAAARWREVFELAAGAGGARAALVVLRAGGAAAAAAAAAPRAELEALVRAAAAAAAAHGENLPGGSSLEDFGDLLAFAGEHSYVGTDCVLMLAQNYLQSPRSKSAFELLTSLTSERCARELIQALGPSAPELWCAVHLRGAPAAAAAARAPGAVAMSALCAGALGLSAGAAAAAAGEGARALARRAAAAANELGEHGHNAISGLITCTVEFLNTFSTPEVTNEFISSISLFDASFWQACRESEDQSKYLAAWNVQYALLQAPGPPGVAAAQGQEEKEVASAGAAALRWEQMLACVHHDDPGSDGVKGDGGGGATPEAEEDLGSPEYWWSARRRGGRGQGPSSAGGIPSRRPARRAAALRRWFLAPPPAAAAAARAPNAFSGLQRVVLYGAAEATTFLAKAGELPEDRYSDGISARLYLLSAVGMLAFADTPVHRRVQQEHFKTGESVLYSTMRNVEKATIVKVHLEDGVADPYYTITLPDGREKQTVKSKLSRESLVDEVEGPNASASDEAQMGQATIGELLVVLDEVHQELIRCAAGPQDQPQDALLMDARLALLEATAPAALARAPAAARWVDLWMDKLRAFAPGQPAAGALAPLRLLRAAALAAPPAADLQAAAAAAEGKLGSLEDALERPSGSAGAGGDRCRLGAAALEACRLVTAAAAEGRRHLGPDLRGRLERLLRAAAAGGELETARGFASILTTEFLRVTSKEFKAFALGWAVAAVLPPPGNEEASPPQVAAAGRRVLLAFGGVQELPSAWAPVRDNQGALLDLLLGPVDPSSACGGGCWPGRAAAHAALSAALRCRRTDFRDQEASSPPAGGGERGEGGEEETKEGLLSSLENDLNEMKIFEDVERAERQRDIEIACRILPVQLRSYLESFKSFKDLLKFRIMRDYNTCMGNDEDLMPEDTDEEVLPCIEEKIFLLACLLLMDFVASVDDSDDLAKGALSSYVSHIRLIPMIVEVCFVNMQEKQLNKFKVPNLSAMVVSEMDLAAEDSKDMMPFCMKAFYQTVEAFPALVRHWWSHDCRRGLNGRVSRFTEEHVGPMIMQREIDKIREAEANGKWGDTSEMTVRGSKVSREVTATYMKDECSLEVVIKVPASYPLANVEVNCTRRLGVAEGRWRRWVLQIVTLLGTQDGSVLDAVLLWKQNVDREFEGVDPCPICFSILYPKDHALPTLPCKTCQNKFHSACLYKWFHTSRKNKCPLCQQPF